MHIAIIPDGNRRWAKEQGLPSFAGHEAGVKALQKILQAALDNGVTHVTVWIASINNITKRGAAEVSFLFKLFTAYFNRLAKEQTIHDNGIRVRVLGRWPELCPPACQKAAARLISATQNYTDRALTFLLGYNGTTEMTDAVAAMVREGRANPDLAVSEATVKQFLYTKDLPPVDLVIRTGGDPHLSTGFMMWDTADAQLFFSQNYLPAFTPEEFVAVLTQFNDTERRFGK